jgi:hypothetical protein
VQQQSARNGQKKIENSLPSSLIGSEKKKKTLKTAHLGVHGPKYHIARPPGCHGHAQKPNYGAYGGFEKKKKSITYVGDIP